MVADALSPTIVPIVVVGLAALATSGALVVALGGRNDSGPADVAVAYEYAWDRLDFSTLWNLSSPRMRDGRSQADFVRDKRAAYEARRELAGLVRAVRPENVEIRGPLARVSTRLELTDGQSVVDEMVLERVGSGGWQVAAYRIASRPPGPARAASAGT